jgi:hypothetical protein
MNIKVKKYSYFMSYIVSALCLFSFIFFEASAADNTIQLIFYDKSNNKIADVWLESPTVEKLIHKKNYNGNWRGSTVHDYSCLWDGCLTVGNELNKPTWQTLNYYLFNQNGRNQLVIRLAKSGTISDYIVVLMPTNYTFKSDGKWYFYTESGTYKYVDN